MIVMFIVGLVCGASIAGLVASRLLAAAHADAEQERAIATVQMRVMAESNEFLRRRLENALPTPKEPRR